MKTNTDHLIQELTAGLKPVKLVQFSFIDFFKVFSAGILCVLLALGFFGLRNDFSEQIQSLHFWLDVSLILILAVFAILAAFKLSIPSLDNRKSYYLPLIALLLMLISTGVLFLSDDQAFHYTGHGWSCVAEILAMSLLPTAVLFHFIKKAAILEREIIGMLVILGGLAFGLLAAQMTCSDATPLHFALWHLFPSMLVAGSGFYLARKVIKKI